MIGVVAAAAALSDPPSGSPVLDAAWVGPVPRDHKTRAPATLYALKAAELLGVGACTLPLVTVTGPTGPMVASFDRAWRLADGGELTGPGFAGRRSRRIHPMTLLRSLQNQVPASLSIERGWCGPCLNIFDHDRLWPCLIALLPGLIKSHGQAILLLARAGRGEEEGAKFRHRFPGEDNVEGAVALLLGDADRGLGQLSLGPRNTGLRNSLNGFDAALGVFACLSRGVATAAFALGMADAEDALIWTRNDNIHQQNG